MRTRRYVTKRPVKDNDIEWYCATHNLIVEHTGKKDWAFCPKCGEHIHAVVKKLHQVTSYKTAFCKAPVLLDDISVDGHAKCSICLSNAEPVFEEVNDIEEVRLW